MPNQFNKGNTQTVFKNMVDINLPYKPLRFSNFNYKPKQIVPNVQIQETPRIEGSYQSIKEHPRDTDLSTVLNRFKNPSAFVGGFKNENVTPRNFTLINPLKLGNDKTSANTIARSSYRIDPDGNVIFDKPEDYTTEVNQNLIFK